MEIKAINTINKYRSQITFDERNCLMRNDSNNPWTVDTLHSQQELALTKISEDNPLKISDFQNNEKHL